MILPRLYTHVYPLSSLIPAAQDLAPVTVCSNQEIDLTKSQTLSTAGLTNLPSVVIRAQQIIFNNHVPDLSLPEFLQHTPQHALTLGYRAVARTHKMSLNALDAYTNHESIHITPQKLRPISSSLPTVTRASPNAAVHRICHSPEWEALYEAIGPQILLYLLTDPHIVLFEGTTNDNWVQISGRVAHNTDFRKRACSEDNTQAAKRRRVRPNEIYITRHRIFFSGPQRGKNIGGLAKENVLNTLKKEKGDLKRKARHLLKHIFPRRFGLPSLFTASFDDPKPKVLQTAAQMIELTKEDDIQFQGPINTPKRLKCALPLVISLLKRHSECQYSFVLKRCCPSKVSRQKLSQYYESQSEDIDDDHSMYDPFTQLPKYSVGPATQMKTTSTQKSRYFLTQRDATTRDRTSDAKPQLRDFACTNKEVASYVKAIVCSVIPFRFWGCMDNRNIVLDRIEDFIKYQRYETVTLHTLNESIKLSTCGWLSPHVRDSKRANNAPNASEHAARTEVWLEFYYWFWEFFVIDVIKTAFHVTESTSTRHRSLYFRKDDWEKLCKPLIENLKKEVFAELEQPIQLSSRTLPPSFVRLVPKDKGVRPIVNLSKKPLNKQNRSFHKSVNNILENAFQVLRYEFQKTKTGVADVTSHNDIYRVLKMYKQDLCGRSRLKKLDFSENKITNKLPRLFFVKVDIKSCFDTITQERLFKLLEKLLKESSYQVQRYGKVSSIDNRPIRKFLKKATASTEYSPFYHFVSQLAQKSSHAVYSDNAYINQESRYSVLQLLNEHIRQNVVKLGHKFYRQKKGIPQGSILSSLLCSIFYSEMERKHLNFCSSHAGTRLLRYVDDFLLISTDKAIALKFLSVMSAGISQYGCAISPEKTITNFSTYLDGHFVRNVVEDSSLILPYCGLGINPRNLEIHPDSGPLSSRLRDGIAIERSRNPGEAFQKKMRLNAKIRTHMQFMDTTHNSMYAVYLNIYLNFLVLAQKFFLYVKDWLLKPRRQAKSAISKSCNESFSYRPCRPQFRIPVLSSRTQKFLFLSIDNIIHYSHMVIRIRTATPLAKSLGVKCAIQRPCVLWLGKHAFRTILKRDKLPLEILLTQLDVECHRYPSHKDKRLLNRVVKDKLHSGANLYMG